MELAMPVITSLYAGLLGLMSIAIAYKAGSLRGKLGVPLGDGGNTDLLLAMRRQANFVEWVPMALVLLALLELNGTGQLALHILGALLVLFRACHAVGIQAHSMKSVARFVGAMGTMLVTGVLSVWCIVSYLR
jgi:uncharacterized membrane protein YecN with MAPEG domain